MNIMIDQPRVFNGTITIENRESHEHRTFRVRTQPEESKFAPGQRIIALLTGPDNRYDYQPFAFVNEKGIFVWRQHRGRDNRSAYDWYAEMIWELSNPESTWHEKYKIHIAGRCVVCNRKLTTPESISRGIGPICGGKA
jgi:hypothetical protein